MRLKKFGIHNDEHEGEVACKQCGRTYCEDCLRYGPDWAGVHTCRVRLEEDND